MKSRLLKMALTWVAPIVIGYVIKKFEERVNKEINNFKNWDLEHQKQAKQPKDFEVLDNVKQKISNLEQLENLRTIYAIVQYHIDYERYQSYHLKKQSKQEA